MRKKMIVAAAACVVCVSACGAPVAQNVLNGGQGVDDSNPNYKGTTAEVSEYQDIMQDISVYQSYATMRAEKEQGDFESVTEEMVKKDGVLSLDGAVTGNETSGSTQKTNSSGKPSVTDSTELDATLSVTDDFSEYAGTQVRFEGFGTVQVSAQNPEVTFVNDNTCDMYFRFFAGKGVLDSGDELILHAGESSGYDVYNLIGGRNGYVTVECTAVFRGTELNRMVQTIKVETTDGGTSAEEKKYNGALPGDTFTTKVAYDTSHVHCIVVLPAVIAVTKGSYGTDISVGYEITNAEKATTVSVQTSAKVAGVGVQDAALKWTNFILSGGEDVDNEHTTLSYEFPKTLSQSHTVGPIHCTPEGGGKAASDYYGVTEFTFKLEQ